MAVITLAGAADWSTCNGGSPPGATDDIRLNGFALTLDAATCTCASIKAVAVDGTTVTAGTLVQDICTVLNADLVAGSSAVMFPLTGAIAINGAATGGNAAAKYCLSATSGTFNFSLTSAYGGSGTQTAYAVILNGWDGTFTCTNAVGTASHAVRHITGQIVCTNANGSDTTSYSGIWSQTATTTSSATNATGGAGAGSIGWYISASSGTISVGTSTGGSGDKSVGVKSVGGSVNVTLAEGGDGFCAHGVLLDQSTSATTINAVIGTAKGGGVATAAGVCNTASTSCSVAGTDLTGTGPPIGGMVKITDGALLLYQDAAGNAKKFYGDSEMPAVADVKSDVTYGLTDFTGTFTSGPLVGASALVG